MHGLPLALSRELSRTAYVELLTRRMARAVMLRHHYRDELIFEGFVMLEQIIARTARDLEAVGQGKIAEMTLDVARKRGWV